MTTKTKTFPLNVLLTVTTGRLLTTPKNGGNGIEDLYQLLGWMTNDSPFTHQLGRFADECKPWLLMWWPELQAAEDALPALDALLVTKHSDPIGAWLTSLHEQQPKLQAEYAVPRIHVGNHQRKDPLAELIELREGKDGIIVINPPETEA